jgi:YVTN family beta-propeller protein
VNVRISLTEHLAVEANGARLEERRFPGRQGRIVFAYLAAESGRAVPRDELAELLWGDELPATWQKALRVLMTKLRALLDECGIDGSTALTSAFGCYKLTLPPGAWIDVDAAVEAVERSEAALAAGDIDEARSQGAVAAALARRSFLPGEDGSWVDERRRDLRDVLVRALECVRDSSFGTGDFAEAVRCGEEINDLEPFRESGYRRLMEIHTAAGNPAEALRVYERCRQLLADELGAYPSQETETIYLDILRSGPAAKPEPTWVRPREVHEPAGKAAHFRRRSARRLALVTAAVAVVLVAALGAYLALGRSNAGLTGVGGNAVGVIAADTGTIEGQIDVGASPGEVAAGEDAVWVTNTDDASVSRIDPRTGSVRQTIDVGTGPAGLTVAGGAVWVANTLDGTVSRIDPRTNDEVQRIVVGNHPTGIAAGMGSVWAVNSVDGTISRIDLASGDVTGRTDVGGGIGPVAFGFGSLWTTDAAAGRLLRIDVRAGRVVEAINVGTRPTAVVAGGGAVWVANGGDGTVSRIDPRRNVVTGAITTGTGGQNALAASEDAVWVSDESSGTLTRLDPQSGGVVERVDVGNRPQGITVTGKDVYVAVRASAATHRGGVLRVIGDDLDSLDPALAFSPEAYAVVSLTSDGLTTFRRVGGGAGTQTVPDLATALPMPAAGGREYTFRLREGIRYSTGRPVRARDFRFALERAFRRGADSPIAFFLPGIVGVTRCIERPADCDLSRGVLTDDRAGTVTFRLVAPDRELPSKLALPFAFPVPGGTPLKVSRRGVPGTGPYEVAELTSTRLRLVRNPSFREWSAAAQPDGIPDEITWLFGSDDTEQSIRAVLEGRADLLWQLSTLPESLDLHTRFPSQLRTTPALGTFHVALNERMPPFDDVDARRAVNYAVDRDQVVGLFGGPESARSTCQILPPGLPAYEAYCPFTAHPTSGGTWTGVDLAKARALVARSGTRGARVTVTYSPGLPGPGVGPYIASVLRQLGYRVRERSLEDPHFWATVNDPRRMGEAAVIGWFADYATPYAFLSPQFRCSVREAPNYVGFCEQDIDRKMRRAVTLQSTDPRAANALWAEIERHLVDTAAWVPLVNPRTNDVVSNRLGNYQYNPAMGSLLSQLWVR